MSKTSWLVKPLLNIFVILLTFSCVFPVVWVGYTSLKTMRDFSRSIVALPADPVLDNYNTVLNAADFAVYFRNSLIVSILTLTFVIILAFVTGYFLSRFRFRGRNLLYGFFVLGIVIPSHAWLLPVFIQFKNLNLLDTQITLVLPYITFSLPIAIFLVESYMRGLPLEMEEAAMMEGCGLWQTLFRIILPMTTPVLTTVLILTFNTSWNEFPFALVLINKQALKTIPVALTMFSGAYTTNYPQMMAAIMISVVPVILVYMLFSKRIIEGMTAGAVKG